MTHYTIRNNVVSGDYLYAPAWNSLNESNYDNMSATVAWTLGNRSGSFSSGNLNTKRYNQTVQINFNFISARNLTYNQVEYRFVGVCAAVIQNGSPSNYKVIAAEHDYGTIVAWDNNIGKNPEVSYTDVPIDNYVSPTYRAAAMELWPIVGGADYVYSFAIYEKITRLTITFNANGGSVSEPTRIVLKGDAIGALPVPTITGGWEFNGWFAGDSGSYSQITAETRPTADATYYAIWGGVIKYHSNFGTDEIIEEEFGRGETVTLKSCPFERTYYQFNVNGWHYWENDHWEYKTQITLNKNPEDVYATWVRADYAFGVRVTKTHAVGTLKMYDKNDQLVATESNGELNYEGYTIYGPFRIECECTVAEEDLYNVYGISNRRSYTFTPTGGQDYAFSYVFEAKPLYGVTIRPAANGSVVITNPSAPDSQGKYAQGRNLTFAGTPDADCIFTAAYVTDARGLPLRSFFFSNGTIDEDGEFVLAIYQDVIVNPVFKTRAEVESQYANVSVGYAYNSDQTQGSVAVTAKSDTSPISSIQEGGGGAHVAIGSSIEVQATASEGYRFAGWYDGTGSSANLLSKRTVAMIEVTADGMTICAMFVESNFGIYKWEGSSENMTMTWRSKTYAATKPFAPSACRVDALGYNADDKSSRLALSVESFSAPDAAPTSVAKLENIESQDARRLPVVRSERYHQVEVVANVEVDAILFGTSAGGLAT